jgi:predicted regulator of Ras-like GTPase activity (Roadblock/LC7/MglB family)
MDGLSVAQYSRAKVNLKLIAAQLTLLMKLLDTAVNKSTGGILEDNLLTGQSHYVMMRFLPGKHHYLAVVTDRKSANLGNLRLVTGVYLERLNASMPK